MLCRDSFTAMVKRALFPSKNSHIIIYQKPLEKNMQTESTIKTAAPIKRGSAITICVILLRCLLFLFLLSCPKHDGRAGDTEQQAADTCQGHLSRAEG